MKENTPASGSKAAKKHGIGVPVGFDAHVDGNRLSTFMFQYGTGATPWTIVIDKKGIVRMSEITPSSTRVARLIEKLRKS